MVKVLQQVFHDNEVYDNLVEKGKDRLLVFDDSERQAKKYLNIFRDIANK